MADRSEQLIVLRRADSKAKAARVLAVLEASVASGEALALAALARRAGVSRRFLYDHPELRAETERRAAEHADRLGQSVLAGARVTTASLRADLENSRARNRVLESELSLLKRRLGEMLGAEALADDVANASIIVGRADPRVVELEQKLADLEEALARRSEELEAAREINRELMARLNR